MACRSISTTVPPFPTLLALAAFLVLSCGSDRRPASAPDRADADRTTRLFLAGDGEAWVVDPGAERARRLAFPELVGGDPPYRVVRRGELLVGWGYATYVFDPHEPRPPRVLTRRSWFFIPSATEDRLWIAYLDARTGRGQRRLRALREMSIDGTVTVPDVRPPGGRWPERATNAGLLFADEETVDVWDPVKRQVVRSFDRRWLGDLGPTRGDLLASSPSPWRRLRLTDVGTGFSRAVRAPDGYAFEPWTGQFSANRRLLGVAVRPAGHGASADRRLAIVDVASATARLVARSRVRAGYNFAVWSRSGDEVFLTGGTWVRDRSIVAYRLNDGRARRLKVTVGAFYGAAAA